jgi:RNA polymerase sigma-70 factor (sigma-E family)
MSSALPAARSPADVSDTFDTFARRELPGLLRLAGVLAGDRATGEDVVQEVLLRASRHWARICAGGAPQAYVRRMVVNEYVSWRRKWGRLVPSSEIIDERVSPDHAEQQADRAELAQLLDRLPARQRAVLVLRYYEGMSDVAVAEVLGCSTGTVRSHASRALASLRVDSQPVAVAQRKEG